MEKVGNPVTSRPKNAVCVPWDLPTEVLRIDTLDFLKMRTANALGLAVQIASYSA